ncbi:MAG TPA: ABC transporter permease [Hyphomicrobiales bacterium]|nr:ABC transporter permease [Hyphomicrobiales bacterium]
MTAVAVEEPVVREGGDEPAPRDRRPFAGSLVPAAYAVASLILLGLLWQGASMLVGADVLPGPIASFRAVEEARADGYLWSDIVITALRVVGAFALALVASVVGGALLGWSPVLARLFGPWVTIAASVPALVLIIVVYLAVGIDDRGAMVATAVVVAPTMTYGVWDGMRAINPELQEMARAFRVPRFTILRRVLLPQTTPFVFTAARTGLSLTWRIMIFVELLGRSSGVGYRIQYFYNLADMRRVVAAALPFLVLMLLVEFCLLRPLERWVFRWRREETR